MIVDTIKLLQKKNEIKKVTKTTTKNMYMGNNNDFSQLNVKIFCYEEEKSKKNKKYEK